MVDTVITVSAADTVTDCGSTKCVGPLSCLVPPSLTCLPCCLSACLTACLTDCLPAHSAPPLLTTCGAASPAAAHCTAAPLQAAPATALPAPPARAPWPLSFPPVQQTGGPPGSTRAALPWQLPPPPVAPLPAPAPPSAPATKPGAEACRGQDGSYTSLTFELHLNLERGVR